MQSIIYLEDYLGCWSSSIFICKNSWENCGQV